MSVHRMPPAMPPSDEPFDPRLAALTHAGMAERLANREPAPGALVSAVTGELANAVACGLVYVGDQIAKMNERPIVLGSAAAVNAWRAWEERDAEVDMPGIERVARELDGMLGECGDGAAAGPVRIMLDGEPVTRRVDGVLRALHDAVAEVKRAREARHGG